MVKMGKVHSCGYTDDGIGHNCCKIVDEMKKRIYELEESVTDEPKPNVTLIIRELQKLMVGKKNES